jgi:thymidylate synthase (FAD)
MTPTEIPVLNHGYVALVDVMGDDRTAARCARTSYRNAAAERSVEDDAKLTRYLVTHKHTNFTRYNMRNIFYTCNV